jgi:ParB/RepB/Spo0J family partition protein
MTATKKLQSVKNTTSEATVAVAAQPKDKTKNSANLKLVGGTDFQNQFRDLPLDLIEPGENWRKEFDTPEFDLFVENIRENGVLETILVTPIAGTDRFKIIAGERRYRASTKAGLSSIPARILNLSDDKLMDAHIAENLQRKDLEAMEEAEGYQTMIKLAESRKITLTISDIARRVGKPADHVALRFQLNNLIPEAKQDVRDGLLEPKIAEVVASYPVEQQMEIYRFCYGTKWESGKNVMDKSDPETLRSINGNIAKNVTLDLDFAPFSRKSTELRADGLTCDDCKKRTGAETLLFKDLNDAKKDLCMDRACFVEKAKKHVQLVQITVARANVVKALPKRKKGEAEPEISEKQIEKEVGKIPRLSTSYYEYGDEGILGRDSYTEIKKKRDGCTAAVTGIFVKGNDRFGQTIQVCLKKSACPKHYPPSSTGSSKNVNSGDDYKKNRQQLFDLRADQKTRRKVLTEAAAQFDENKTVWGDEKLRLLMLASMIKSIGYNERHRRTLVAEILGLEEKTLDNDTYGATDFQILEIYEKLAKVSEAVQSKLFFLLTVASFGENQYETRGIKQTLVESLAEHLGINYNLLGAEARVDLCAEKYKKQLPEAKAHLEKIGQSSVPVPFPSFFFDFAAEKKAADDQAATENAEAESIETKSESDELVAA